MLVPSTEDVLTVDDQLVQSGPGEIEAVLSAEQSKYLNLTQVDVAQTAQSPEAIDEIEKSEPAPETVLEATQAATESAYEDVAEPPLEQMPVVVDEVSVGSPVVAAELSSVAEDAGVEGDAAIEPDAAARDGDEGEQRLGGAGIRRRAPRLAPIVELRR